MIFLLISYSLQVGRITESGCPFLNYTEADFEGMCDFLLDWDFDSCYFSQDVEVIWSRIKLAILTAIGKFVPIVTVSKRHSHLPRWFNSSVYHDLKRVRTIRRQCVSSPTPAYLESLFQLESKLKAAIAKAETHYVSSLLQQSMEDKSSARIYAHIRYVIKQSLIPPVFLWGPSLPLLMLSRLTYLRSIFFHLFSRLLSSLFNLSPKRCITAVVWMPSPPHLMFSWFFLNSILLKLWVQMVFLKLCAAALCEPLHHLFCASLTTSCIPSKWKVHYITSIQ